jgi:heme/copper-type cytochrome/quinol oxidase subunit 2
MVMIIPIIMIKANAVSLFSVSGDNGNSGMAVILTATVLIVILIVVSAVTVFLVAMVIILLRRNLQIKKELKQAKESSTYEEIDISTPASIGTEGNISYCPVSRK